MSLRKRKSDINDRYDERRNALRLENEKRLELLVKKDRLDSARSLIHSAVKEMMKCVYTDSIESSRELSLNPPCMLCDAVDLSWIAKSIPRFYDLSNLENGCGCEMKAMLCPACFINSIRTTNHSTAAVQCTRCKQWLQMKKATRVFVANE